VPAGATGSFTVDLGLQNGHGEVIAENSYTLLIGDQATAKEHSLELQAEAAARIREHGHSVYRYWPEMWTEVDPA